MQKITMINGFISVPEDVPDELSALEHFSNEFANRYESYTCTYKFIDHSSDKLCGKSEILSWFNIRAATIHRGTSEPQY